MSELDELPALLTGERLQVFKSEHIKFAAGLVEEADKRPVHFKLDTRFLT